ncbi:MAG TPA: ankyrin repeat domain-containing protein [Myxococcales bacterium]|nr:ankyrin repeat domain-containing protein [Myxococcales bacterium]
MPLPDGYRNGRSLAEKVNPTDRGWTPLLAAVQGSRLETARLLIERGADVRAQNPMGYTALEFAAHGGHLEICKMLVERGALIDVADHESGATTCRRVGDERTEVVAHLLGHGEVAGGSRTRGIGWLNWPVEPRPESVQPVEPSRPHR